VLIQPVHLLKLLKDLGQFPFDTDEQLHLPGRLGRRRFRSLFGNILRNMFIVSHHKTCSEDQQPG